MSSSSINDDDEFGSLPGPPEDLPLVDADVPTTPGDDTPTTPAGEPQPTTPQAPTAQDPRTAGQRRPASEPPPRDRAKRHKHGDEELVAMYIENEKWWKAASFMARRREGTIPKKKGRELKSIPDRFKEDFAKADYAEWRKWVSYDAVELVPEEVVATLARDQILPLRPVRTDKAEATRGDRTYEEHHLVARTRYVSPGYADKQALEKPLETDAPTLSAEGTAMIYAEAAGNNWRHEAGDVDSAFLSGRYLAEDRVVYFKAPKGGLPAVPDHGWPALPEGTVLKAKKASYGLKDAPLQWYLVHAGQILTLPGAKRSKLNPALFYFKRNNKLVGLIGVHVDDDLITGDERFFAEVVPLLKKMFSFGWCHNATMHCRFPR